MVTRDVTARRSLRRRVTESRRVEARGASNYQAQKNSECSGNFHDKANETKIKTTAGDAQARP